MTDEQNMNEAEQRAADEQKRIADEREKLAAEQAAALEAERANAEKEAKNASRRQKDAAKRGSKRSAASDDDDDPISVFDGANVVSVQDVRRRQMMETQEIAARRRIDEVENPCYFVGGRLVDPNGEDVKTRGGIADEIKSKEQEIERLREQLQLREAQAIMDGMQPLDRIETGETTIAMSARGGASTI